MTVRFTRPAQQDLLNIYAYVARDNPEAASRIVARLIERCRALSDTPYQGRQTDEPGAFLLVLSPLHYFIFYNLEGDDIAILNIRHTARKRPRSWNVD